MTTGASRRLVACRFAAIAEHHFQARPAREHIDRPRIIRRQFRHAGRHSFRLRMHGPHEPADWNGASA